MKRVIVLCEGQTEANFIVKVLAPAFFDRQVYLYPQIVANTGRSRGGITKYPPLKRDILRTCRGDATALVTTLIDFYGLHDDFPGMQLSHADPIERIRLIEREFQNDIGQGNFLANLVAHEFEGLLFSDSSKFTDLFGQGVASELTAIRLKYPTPEHIDDGPWTAPSKRIQAVCGNRYQKPQHGPLIAGEIGLEVIRRECPKFSAWIDKIEKGNAP